MKPVNVYIIGIVCLLISIVICSTIIYIAQNPIEIIIKTEMDDKTYESVNKIQEMQYPDRINTFVWNCTGINDTYYTTNNKEVIDEFLEKGCIIIRTQ